MVCAQVTIVATVRKELVTNLTSDENLINASLIATGGTCGYTYIEKYQEGDNWVFVYDVVDCNLVEFGGATALANFLAANFAIVAILFLSVIGFTVVWMWRDAVTKEVEVDAKMADNQYNCVQAVLSNTSLTPEEQQAQVELCLQLGPESTDWATIGLGAAVILGAAYVLGNRKSRKR